MTNPANTMASNLRSRLQKLSDVLPILQNSDQPVKNAWSSVLRGLDELAAEATAQALVLEMINTISEISHVGSTLDEVLNELVGVIHNRLGLCFVGIFLADTANEYAHLRAGTGDLGRSILSEPVILKIDDKSNVGRAIQQQRAIIITSSNASSFYSPDLSKASAEAVLPLGSQGEVFGVLLLQSINDAAFHLDEHTMVMLKPLAVCVAHTVQTTHSLVAIDQKTEQLAAELVERKTREAKREKFLTEMTTLYNGSQEIGHALSEKQVLDALFQQICTQDPNEVSAYYVKLVDGVPIWAEQTAHWQKNKASAQSSRQRIFADEALRFKLFTTKKVLFIEDVATDERLSEADRAGFAAKGTCSLAILPMSTFGQEIGVLVVYFSRPFIFSKGIKRFWQAMVDQASVLLANRQLIQEVANRAVQLETAAEIARTASSILDVNALLNSAVRLIRDRFDLYYVGVFLLDPAKEWAELRAGTGHAGRTQLAEKHRLRVGGTSMIGWCLANLKARVALDVGKDAVHFQNPHLPDTRSEMAVPLIHRNEAIGALTVQSTEQAAFSRQDTIFFKTMADQMANAIVNADLFEKAQSEIKHRRRIGQEILQRNRELAAINRVTTAVTSTLELQSVLQAITREMAETIQAHTCGVAQLNEDRTELTIVAEYLAQPNAPSAKNTVIPVIGNPSSSQVIETGMSLIVPEPQTNSLTLPIHDLMRERQTQCLMIVPLRVRGEVIGTIGLDIIQDNREFTAAEVELVETIAGQVASAVENARLFEQMQTALVERKRSEEALRKSEEKYRLLLASSPDPIVMYDDSGRATYVNESFVQTFGWTADELLGQRLDFVPKENWPENQQALERVFRDETVFFESKRLTKAGRVLNVLVSGAAHKDKEGKPAGTIAILRDITERKQAETALQEALARTQALYRVGNALARAGNDEQTTFEVILGEYLQLLKLKRGGLMFFDEGSGHHQIGALFMEGRAVKPSLILPVEKDYVSQHLINNPTPLVIEDVQKHPATKDNRDFLEGVQSMLLIPVILREKVVGVIGADSLDPDRTFIQSDIEIGQVIADQLAIWLENRQLLKEAQKRSSLLQTAAEVSRAASSILDVDQLINKSVNLIRDKFDFYYVGLFLVDQAREWAVLRAGTGEAGRIQLKKKHRLKVGGESMIGWCIQQHQARITPDVGADAVHFQNPDLPDTRSEMALPLISRDEIIGALTVQSTLQNAFTNEDITLLQTMADQTANAIKNAHLFEEITQAQEEAEERLQETIALQQLSQALSGTLHVNEILDIFFRACTKVIGFEYVLLSLVDNAQQRVKAIGGVGISENNIRQAICPLNSTDIMADIIKTGRTEIISGWDDRFNRKTFRAEGRANWVRLFTPITLRQDNIGLVEAGIKRLGKKGGLETVAMAESQVRLLRAFIDQTALALENARLYEASQRATRREALIKEITTKVRASTDVDTILQTAVKELGEAISGKKAYIHLFPPTNGDKYTSGLEENSSNE